MFRVELCPAVGGQEVRDVIWDTRLRGVKDQRPEVWDRSHRQPNQFVVPRSDIAT